MQDTANACRISVRSLLLRPDEVRELDLTLSSEAAAEYGIGFEKLPHIAGKLENRAGVLMLTYTLTCVPVLECARCLSPVYPQIEEQFSHVIVTETASEQNDAEYLLAPDAMLDLAETAMTDLRLSLPARTLCRSDCRGLCPICGQNRNENACACVSADITLDYQ